MINFSEIVDFFSNQTPAIKNMTNLMMQLNLYIDHHRLLRVGRKVPRSRNYPISNFPISQ